jgi:hypothetical protein
MSAADLIGIDIERRSPALEDPEESLVRAFPASFSVLSRLATMTVHLGGDSCIT